MRSVIAARLEPGDVPEDEAADRLANALMAPLLARVARRDRAGQPARRDRRACWCVDAATIDRLNALDESADRRRPCPTTAGRRAEGDGGDHQGHPLRGARRRADGGRGAWRSRARRRSPLHPFRPLKVGLVLTELPGLKESVMEGAVEATRDRVEALLRHAAAARARAGTRNAPIADALNRLRRQGAEMLLVAGASAVVDRRDVGPAGDRARRRRRSSISACRSIPAT